MADLYLVVEIYDPVAPAASFYHRYIVPPSAAELFRLLALSSETLPLEVTSAPSLEIFRKLRISYLLTQSYPDISINQSKSINL